MLVPDKHWNPSTFHDHVNSQVVLHLRNRKIKRIVFVVACMLSVGVLLWL